MKTAGGRLAGRLALWMLAGVLLWAALHDLDLRAVRRVLEALTVPQLGILLAVNAGILLLLGSRWWLILRGQGYPVPFLAAAAYRLAAFGVSYFTPGPHLGGEPLQVALAVRRERVPAGEAAAAVVIDKLLELSANFVFLVFGVYALLAEGLLGGQLAPVGLAAAAGFSALPVLYLAALAAGRRPFSALMERLGRLGRPGFLARAQRFAGEAEAAAGRFVRVRRRVLMAAVLLSALIWVALIAEFLLAVRFLGLDLGFAQVVAVMAAARIANLLPVPAGLGALEAALVLVARSLGEPAAVGAGLSILIRVRDISFGLLGLWLGRRLFDRPANIMENR